jgi:hypothetical protein
LAALTMAPWGHIARIALCSSPAGRASASGLLWVQKRASRSPPLASEDRERGPNNGVREACHCAPTDRARRKQPKRRARLTNPLFSRTPSGCHRRANCGPAVERAAIGALAKGVGARCTALCRSTRRRSRRGRCSVPAEGHGGVLLRPRCGRRSVEGHWGVLDRPRCGRCHLPAEGNGGVLLRPRCGRRSMAAGRGRPQHGEPQGRQLRGGKEETGSG